MDSDGKNEERLSPCFRRVQDTQGHPRFCPLHDFNQANTDFNLGLLSCMYCHVSSCTASPPNLRGQGSSACFSTIDTVGRCSRQRRGTSTRNVFFFSRKIHNSSCSYFQLLKLRLSGTHVYHQLEWELLLSVRRLLIVLLYFDRYTSQRRLPYLTYASCWTRCFW